MRIRPDLLGRWLAAALLIAAPLLAGAHVTPPIAFVSDRDAIRAMTAGASGHFVREGILTSAEQRVIATQWGWEPVEPSYRFYVGRDGNGHIISAVTFLTEHTLHGPLRVAVALGPDGKVRDARITEATEDIATWVRPLVAEDFFRQFVGLDSRGSFAARSAAGTPRGDMARFYGEVAARLVRHGAILFHVVFLEPEKNRP